MCPGSPRSWVSEKQGEQVGVGVAGTDGGSELRRLGWGSSQHSLPASARVHSTNQDGRGLPCYGTGLLPKGTWKPHKVVWHSSKVQSEIGACTHEGNLRSAGSLQEASLPYGCPYQLDFSSLACGYDQGKGRQPQQRQLPRPPTTGLSSF